MTRRLARWLELSEKAAQAIAATGYDFSAELAECIDETDLVRLCKALKNASERLTGYAEGLRAGYELRGKATLTQEKPLKRQIELVSAANQACLRAYEASWGAWLKE